MKMLYILFIFILFLLTLPLQAFIALGILLTSGAPVLFCQRRVGKNGKVFVMYKFRTMQVGAEEGQVKLQKRNEADGPVFKIHNDPRFTRVGKFLSHTGLDELPQLFNVLTGDMALIGPRPLPTSEEKKLSQWQKKREGILPGIISPWILNGHHKTHSFETWMKSDIEYMRHKSFLYDTTLFFKSVGFMMRLLIVNC